MGDAFKVIKAPEITWSIGINHPLWLRKYEISHKIAEAAWMDVPHLESPEDKRVLELPVNIGLIVQTIIRMKELGCVSNIAHTTLEDETTLVMIRNLYNQGYANIIVAAQEVECEIIRIDFYKND